MVVFQGPKAEYEAESVDWYVVTTGSGGSYPDINQLKDWPSIQRLYESIWFTAGCGVDIFGSTWNLYYQWHLVLAENVFWGGRPMVVEAPLETVS